MDKLSHHGGHNSGRNGAQQHRNRVDSTSNQVNTGNAGEYRMTERITQKTDAPQHQKTARQRTADRTQRSHGDRPECILDVGRGQAQHFCQPRCLCLKWNRDAGSQ